MKNKSLNFSENLIKGSEFKINISLKNNPSSIPVNFFIKNYKISNFWKGNFFIKRLIKKIFKYNLNKKLIWEKNFWNMVSIDMYQSTINILNDNSDDFENELEKKMTLNRYNDVVRYRKLLNDGIDLGRPLYITSEVLNLLNANISENNIYILDGSRRLAAHALVRNNPEILIINLKNKFR